MAEQTHADEDRRRPAPGRVPHRGRQLTPALLAGALLLGSLAATGAATGGAATAAVTSTTVHEAGRHRACSPRTGCSRWLSTALTAQQSVVTDAMRAAEDPLHRRVVAELSVFTEWLERNDAEGYIGEVGIEADADVDRWTTLAERWFAEAGAADLWVDGWSTGEWWGTDYHYSLFRPAPQGGPLATATAPGRLLAQHARDDEEPRGVNVSGGEFGAAGGQDATSAFSNRNPGVYDTAYHYDSQSTFDLLAAQGLDTVRLPFRWERVQPTPGGDLDPAEVERLRGAVRRAQQAGLEVILDVHNFGAYHLDDGTRGIRRAIGSTEISQEQFADLWRRLSQTFHDEPAVLAYGLMNEPIDLPAVGDRTPAQVWESASQAAVDAIRATGDDTLIMISGYEWSHAGEWAKNHPRAWIDDPADHIRYEAHHYWIREEDKGSTYDTELTHARNAGH